MAVDRLDDGAHKLGETHFQIGCERWQGTSVRNRYGPPTCRFNADESSNQRQISLHPTVISSLWAIIQLASGMADYIVKMIAARGMFNGGQELNN